MARHWTHASIRSRMRAAQEEGPNLRKSPPPMQQFCSVPGSPQEGLGWAFSSQSSRGRWGECLGAEEEEGGIAQHPLHVPFSSSRVCVFTKTGKSEAHSSVLASQLGRGGDSKLPLPHTFPFSETSKASIPVA